MTPAEVRTLWTAWTANVGRDDDGEMAEFGHAFRSEPSDLVRRAIDEYATAAGAGFLRLAGLRATLARIAAEARGRSASDSKHQEAVRAEAVAWADRSGWERCGFVRTGGADMDPVLLREACLRHATHALDVGRTLADWSRPAAEDARERMRVIRRDLVRAGYDYAGCCPLADGAAAPLAAGPCGSVDWDLGAPGSGWSRVLVTLPEQAPTWPGGRQAVEQLRADAERWNAGGRAVGRKGRAA